MVQKNFIAQSTIGSFISSVFTGYAQIAFQDHVICGIMLLAIIGIASPVQAISSLCAILVSTLLSYWIGVPKDQIRNGLYGFNAALAGLAIPPLLFPGQTVTITMLMFSGLAGILCSFLTAASGTFFSKWNVPALATPYCLTLIILIITYTFSHPSVSSDATTVVTSATATYTLKEVLTAAANGIAQVIWLDKPICGILYLVAILLHSRRDVLISCIGSLAATTIAIAIGLPKDSVLLGIYGFNAVLLMNVLARFFPSCIKTYILAVFAAGFTPIFAIVWSSFLAPLGIHSFLALPYTATCIILLLTGLHSKESVPTDSCAPDNGM